MWERRPAQGEETNALPIRGLKTNAHRCRDAGREWYGESSQDEVDHGREYRYVLAGDCQNMGNGSIMYGKQAAF